MITLNDPKTEQHIKALRCIASPVTQQVIPGMLQEIFDMIGYTGDEQVEVNESWKAGNLTSNVFVTDDSLYEWLMNSPETAIGEKISAQVTKTMVFVSHDMCEYTLRVWVSCKLPEEDFNTLDMLGKVHREYKPGKMEQSIYCEI